MKRRVGASKRKRLARRASERARMASTPPRELPRCPRGDPALKYHSKDADGQGKWTCVRFHDYIAPLPEDWK